MLIGLREQLHSTDLDSITKRSLSLLAPLDQLMLLAAIGKRLDQLVDALATPKRRRSRRRAAR